MQRPPERLDAIRARSTDRENHLIDELRLGRIGRREFVRRAAVAGMALPLAGFIATACGAGATRSRRPTPHRPVCRSKAARSASVRSSHRGPLTRYW